ncbi:uncharacterized protein V1510DRAFT_286391 [Dipodascopsis tothii]|uniref:uncharacterized protein n=1 Tax=Dipodascopsis tothii TaxID=44089 RepID=UPI0034CD9D08
MSYPEIGVIAGVQGVLVYALTSSLPILMFAFLGPHVRKRCPDGFVLTEWVFRRFGYIPGLYLGILTILTMFLYMASELTSIQSVVTYLTGLDALPVVIVQCAVTTIYTSWGGFHTSFFTDNVQGVMMTVLMIIVAIAMGTQIDVDRERIVSSGLTQPNRLGWQLIYMFSVAIASNDCFMSGFWLRTFASRNDRELLIACGLASFVLFTYLTLAGFTGILADWAGLLGDTPEDNAYLSFFLLLNQLPGWVVGFVLVFSVAMSTAVFDSLQSAMATSISNDIFRNRIPTIYVRGIVVLVIAPAIVVALRSPNVLNIYLISDLISCSAMPSILLGLVPAFSFINGFDVIVSGLGGILTIFFYGWVYTGTVQGGGGMLILEEGLYGGDWSAFGAFVAAPVGAVAWLIGSVALRYIYKWWLRALLIKARPAYAWAIPAYDALARVTAPFRAWAASTIPAEYADGSDGQELQPTAGTYADSHDDESVRKTVV